MEKTLENTFDVFSDEYLGSVRTMFNPKTNEIYFHAVDVAVCLGHRSAATAVSIHTDMEDRYILTRKEMPEEISKLFWSSTRGRGQVTFLKEAALYKFIMASRTEIASKFQDWICGTVLVSIRKNGGYILGQENLPEEAVSDEIQQLRLKVLEQTAAITGSKAKIEKLQKRRHELIAELEKKKTLNSSMKKELRYMIADSNYWCEMYFKLMEDYEAMVNRSKELSPATGRDNVMDGYVMLPDGLVIKKSEWSRDTE